MGIIRLSKDLKTLKKQKGMIGVTSVLQSDKDCRAFKLKKKSC